MASPRPFQIILMAIFGGLAIAGLVAFATFSGFATKGPEIGPVVIWGTLPQETMSAALLDYARTNKAFEQVVYVEHPVLSFEDDLANAIASGQGPSLIIISQEQLVAEANRLSVIPSSVISEREYREYLPINELYLTGGGTYAIPFLVDPLVMYYNRSIFASAGAANAPTTWEAVTGFAGPVIRTNDAGDVIQALVPFGGYTNFENARALVSLLFLQALAPSGGSITSLGASGIRSTLSEGSSSAGVRPAESALDFYAQFSMPAKTVYTWNSAIPSARQAFLGGTLALYPGFASERRSLEAGNPNLDFDMASVPQPGVGAVRLTYGRAYAFAIPKASGNSEGALNAALTLASSGPSSTFARALGMAPALRSELIPSPNDLYEPIFYPEALVARGWLSPAPSQTDGIFAGMIRDVTSGRASADTAISTADQNLNAALR